MKELEARSHIRVERLHGLKGLLARLRDNAHGQLLVAYVPKRSLDADHRRRAEEPLLAPVRFLRDGGVQAYNSCHVQDAVVLALDVLLHRPPYLRMFRRLIVLVIIFVILQTPLARGRLLLPSIRVASVIYTRLWISRDRDRKGPLPRDTAKQHTHLAVRVRVRICAGRVRARGRNRHVVHIPDNRFRLLLGVRVRQNRAYGHLSLLGDTGNTFERRGHARRGLGRGGGLGLARRGGARAGLAGRQSDSRLGLLGCERAVGEGGDQERGDIGVFGLILRGRGVV